MKFLLLGLLVSFTSIADTGHYISLGYDLRTIAQFDDTYATDGTDSASGFDVKFRFDSGLALAYEYRQAKANSFGFAVGIDYHRDRDADTIEIDSTSLSLTGDVATISFTQLYINAIYKWESFYIPFGINYTSATYTPPNTYTGTLSSDSGIGINFGLGWEVGDKFLIEYGVKSSAFSIKSQDGQNIADYSDGALATSTLWLRYKLF